MFCPFNFGAFLLIYRWDRLVVMTSSLARSHQARPDFAPVKLSTFHAQALLAWKLIYKHNFSPQRYFIWNNRCILYKHKSIFFEKLV